MKREKDGTATIELTEEEKQAIRDVAKEFEDYGIHRNYAADIYNATTAYALSLYARERVEMSEREFQKENRLELLEKAFAATIKAYSFYDLPIYFYDMACLMEILGRFDLARNGYREFLKKQSEYKPKLLDKAFLKNRDIDEAIKDAKAKAT